MANPKYQYEQKQVDEIIIRKFAFDFPDDLDPVWCPGNRVRSHMFNGFSLTMPYLEPFIIKATQDATGEIDDADLLDDIRQFSGQEARHYQCHRRLNELLKTNGYPELADVEQRLDDSFKRLRTKSLTTQLAFIAGFESMTIGFTNWLIKKRHKLFANSSPHVSSFWLMHMVEEMEHKTVAYDVYMAYSGSYLPRAIGVWHGSLHVLGYGIVGMLTSLRKDRENGQKTNWFTVIREMSSLIYHVGPSLIRAMLPGHNPRQEQDPQWTKDWLAGHAKLTEDQALPLIDTNNPDLPVPFSN